VPKELPIKKHADNRTASTINSGSMVSHIRLEASIDPRRAVSRWWFSVAKSDSSEFAEVISSMGSH